MPGTFFNTEQNPARNQLKIIKNPAKVIAKRQTLLSTFFHSSSSEQSKGKDFFNHFRVHFEKPWYFCDFNTEIRLKS